MSAAGEGGGVDPGWSRTHIKHCSGPGVETQECGHETESVEDDAHPQHVLYPQTHLLLAARSVDYSIAGGGDWQHECMTRSQSHS